MNTTSKCLPLIYNIIINRAPPSSVQIKKNYIYFSVRLTAAQVAKQISISIHFALNIIHDRHHIILPYFPMSERY